MNNIISFTLGAGFVLLAGAAALPLVLDEDAAPMTAPIITAQEDGPETSTVEPAGPASTTEASAGADRDRVRSGTAGDPVDEPARAPGMDRPTFPAAEGTTPTSSSGLERVSTLRIDGDQDFGASSLIQNGSGTLEDPFVISGLYITSNLYLGDTDACFVVKENYISGQLSLNWNGQCVHVHHNHINDLRVNENIKRTGYATGGLLELNKIGYIGQLRHYDGEMRDNIVGPRPDDILEPVLETVPWLFVSDPRAANIDGFNQGLIHHNTFYGSVDLDLHGHHHGTGFFARASHYHGDNNTVRHDEAHDHTMRWTSVAFTDNHIIKVDEDDYGLRYEDRNHAGDDQTARSETEPTLEDDHRHYTHIVIARNLIDGGQIWIDVFNADDPRHMGVNPGWLQIEGNAVHFQAHEVDGIQLPFFGPGTNWYAGIHLNTAKEVDAAIRDNLVTFTAAPEPDLMSGDLDLDPFDDGLPFSGIDLREIRSANITLAGNTIEGFDYGIQAQEFAMVDWIVRDNRFPETREEFEMDGSVPPPRP